MKKARIALLVSFMLIMSITLSGCTSEENTMPANSMELLPETGIDLKGKEISILYIGAQSRNPKYFFILNKNIVDGFVKKWMKNTAAR